MTKAQAQLSKYQAALEKNNKAMAQIDAVRDRRRATDEAKRAWVQASEKAQQLAKSIAQTGQPTQAMISQLEKARAASRACKEEWIKQKAALDQYSKSVGLAGVGISQLNSMKKQLGAEKGALAALNEKHQKWREAYQRNKRRVSENAAYASASGAAMMGGLLNVVGTGSSFDSAMAKVGAVSIRPLAQVSFSVV